VHVYIFHSAGCGLFVETKMPQYCSVCVDKTEKREWLRRPGDIWPLSLFVKCVQGGEFQAPSKSESAGVPFDLSDLFFSIYQEAFFSALCISMGGSETHWTCNVGDARTENKAAFEIF